MKTNRFVNIEKKAFHEFSIRFDTLDTLVCLALSLCPYKSSVPMLASSTLNPSYMSVINRTLHIQQVQPPLHTLV